MNTKFSLTFFHHSALPRLQEDPIRHISFLMPVKPQFQGKNKIKQELPFPWPCFSFLCLWRSYCHLLFHHHTRMNKLSFSEQTHRRVANHLSQMISLIANLYLTLWLSVSFSWWIICERIGRKLLQRLWNIYPWGSQQSIRLSWALKLWHTHLDRIQCNVVTQCHAVIGK